MSGQIRSFLERLLYPYDPYIKDVKTLAPKSVETALIYTMNLTEKDMREAGYDRNLAGIEQTIGDLFQSTPEILYAFNTWEFKDYSRYPSSIWDLQDNARVSQHSMVKSLDAWISGLPYPGRFHKKAS